MKLQEQQARFAECVAQLIDFIFASGYSCTFGEAYRTPEQAKLYAEQGKGIVNSLHCQRLAVDLNIFTFSGDYMSESDEYEKFGVFWENLDHQNRWGGRFKRKDGNHFERMYEL